MTHDSKPIERHYSVAQLADMVGLNVSTVWRHVRSGEIKPVIKLGHRSVRVPASAVNRWLDRLRMR